MSACTEDSQPLSNVKYISGTHVLIPTFNNILITIESKNIQLIQQEIKSQLNCKQPGLKGQYTIIRVYQEVKSQFFHCLNFVK